MKIAAFARVGYAGYLLAVRSALALISTLVYVFALKETGTCRSADQEPSDLHGRPRNSLT